VRGGVLLGVGVVLMVVALCFAVAVGVYATRHAEQVAKTPPSVPAEPPPPEPVEKLKYKRNAPIPKQTSVEVPKSSVPKEPPLAPATNLPQPESVFQPPPELVGDLPAANTATLVSVQTCDGGTLQLNAAEKQMFDLHNRTRTQRGLEPLCVSPYLTQLARARSQDMMNRDYFSHYAPPDDMTVIDQIERSGNPENYGALGENISRGGDGTDTDTPAFMFDGLMHSPGHRANILHEEFSEIGVGALSGKYKTYDDTSTISTMVFGGG
jgi:uncharacterized protein YkwD